MDDADFETTVAAYDAQVSRDTGVDWAAIKADWTWPNLLPFPSSEQQAIVESILHGRNIIVEAVAGAGKTTSMLQTVRVLCKLQPESRALIISYNKRLQEGSECRVQGLRENGVRLNVCCSTLHSLGCRYYGVVCKTDKGLIEICDGAGLPWRPHPQHGRFTHIFIDEGQDFQPILFTFLLKFLVDHGGSPVLAVFGDSMQTVNKHNGSSPAYLTRADVLLPAPPGAQWVRRSLCTSNRVTGNIAAFVNQAVLMRPCLKARKADGPPVHYWCGGAFWAVASLAQLVLRRFGAGKLRADDVMIVTPSVKGRANSNRTPLRELANRLSEGGMPICTKLDDEPSTATTNCVLVTTRHSSKGLERKLVIVMDCSTSHAFFLNRQARPDEVEDDTKCSEAWYVAFTRAESELHIVGHSGQANKYGHVDGPIPFLDMKVMSRLEEDGVVRRHDELCPPMSPSSSDVQPDMALLLVNQLLGQVRAHVISSAMHCLEASGSWVHLHCPSPPAERISVPDVVKVVVNGAVVEQSVSHITGIAIPTMLQVGQPSTCEAGASTSSAGGIGLTSAVYVQAYNELKAHYGSESCQNEGERWMRAKFRALPAPGMATPTAAWYLEVASLWYTVVSIESGFLFKHTQLEPTMWTWLSEEHASRCKERLHTFIVDHDHVDSAAEVVVETTVSCQGKERQLQGQLDVVTPSCVWELKCSRGDITDEHKLQLAMYAWLWRTERESSPRLFRILNVLSGEVWELALTVLQPSGARVWDETRIAALDRCARMLIENKLARKVPFDFSCIEAAHREDLERFRRRAWAHGSMGGSCTRAGGSSGTGCHGRVAGVKRSAQEAAAY